MHCKVGGKCKSLMRLKSAGFRVPKFEILEFDSLKNDSREIITEKIKVITEKIKSDRFAVRSSANVEDSEDRSYAGIFQSFLDLRHDEILDKVYAVVGSVDNLAAHYAGSESNIKMSVIIQDFIIADYSGICFTNYDGYMIINLCPGNGEKLASGEFTGNEARIKRDTFSMTKYDEIFNHVNFDDLVSTFLKVEKKFGVVQDIEFCIVDRVLYILQTRPLTA